MESRAFAPSARRPCATRRTAVEFVLSASSILSCPLEVVGGLEEARLVQRGVAAHWPHEHERVLIIDVGGGSVQLILSDRERFAAGTSLPLGAVRLTELFLGDDPPSDSDVARMRLHIREQIAGGRRSPDACAGAPRRRDVGDGRRHRLRGARHQAIAAAARGSTGRDRAAGRPAAGHAGRPQPGQAAPASSASAGAAPRSSSPAWRRWTGSCAGFGCRRCSTQPRACATASLPTWLCGTPASASRRLLG